MNVEITLKDIDELKEHVATAVTADVKATLDPMLKDIKAALAEIPTLKADVKKLQANQGKALIGWTVLVMGGTALFNSARTWLMSHIHPT